MDLEYNLRGFLHLFFKHKAALLLWALLVIVPGLFFVARLPVYYETKGSILLKFGENARPEINLQGHNQSVRYTYNEREEILRSNVKILQSPDLIKSVIQQIGPMQMYPQLDDAPAASGKEALLKALKRAKENLKVSAGVDNNLIDIEFRHNKGEMAAEFVRLYIEAFKELHTEIYDTPQINFLEEQTLEALQKRNQAQEDFDIFKQERGVSEIDQEIEQLLKQKNELSAIAYQAVTKAQEMLAELKAKEAEMTATYRKDSPLIKSVRESISAAAAQLNQRKSELKKLNATEGLLASQKSEIDERIAWLEEQRGRYNELQQQLNLSEENYKYYRQRQEEARVNNLLNAQNITRIAVISQPSVPLEPAGPKKPLLMVAMIILGLCFTCAMALTMELMDDRLSFPAQIRARFGLPVLATFGKIERVQ